MRNIDINFEKAMKNKDYINIMNKASAKFISQLDEDSLYTCKINALWKAMINFDPARNVKFTTYLFNGVFLECLKECKFHNKYKKFGFSQIHNNTFAEKDIPKYENTHLVFELLDELDDEEEKSLLIDKYCNMTISEMADKRNSNRETTRKKLKNIFSKIEKQSKEVY